MKRPELTERMELVAQIVRRFEAALISAPAAIKAIGEAIEPRVVKVGETHKPEVQS